MNLLSQRKKFLGRKWEVFAQLSVDYYKIKNNVGSNK